MFDSIGQNRIDIGRDEVNSRNQFRALRAALLAGAGTTLLVAAMPAMAQDAAAPAAQEEEDAIVVTGNRETIQNSINTKREDTAIVDALSADDIDALPALSAGQAIQKIGRASSGARVCQECNTGWSQEQKTKKK